MKKQIEHLSTKDAATYLKPHVSHSRVRAMVTQGKFPNSFLIGGKRVISVSDLDAENKRREHL